MNDVAEGTAVRLDGVLFDYGDTLVTFVRPEAALAEAGVRIVAAIEASGRRAPDAAALFSRVLDPVERVVQEHERGGELAEIDVTDAARRAYQAAGLDLDPELLDEVLRLEQDAWWRGARVDPEAVSVLETLRRQGIRVGLCSNAPYRLQSMRAQITHLGLDAHLDAVTFSAEVGWRKPSPHIFSAALNALGTDPAHTVMVGDSERGDIDGAHDAGMRSVLVNRRGAAVASGADAVIVRLSALPDTLRGMRLYWS